MSDGALHIFERCTILQGGSDKPGPHCMCRIAMPQSELFDILLEHPFHAVGIHTRWRLRNVGLDFFAVDCIPGWSTMP